MKTILTVLVIFLGGFSIQAQEKPTALEKMLMKRMFKPFVYELPLEIFDEREEEGNLIAYKSSKFPMASSIGFCTMYDKDMKFPMEKKTEAYDKSTFEYHDFLHSSGIKVNYMTGLTKDKKEKSSNFILHYKNSSFIIALQCLTKNFDKLFEVVKQGVSQLDRK